MKVLAPLSLLAFTCLMSPAAQACRVPIHPTTESYDAAGVVFEGTVLAVHPTFQAWPSHYSEKKADEVAQDLVTNFYITFNVAKVLRGKLSEDKVRVGWKPHLRYFPHSYSEFVKEFGHTLRVGVTTPEQFAKHCSVKSTTKASDGKTVETEPRLSCDIHYSGLYAPDAKDTPYILDEYCGTPYMLPLNSNKDGLRVK